MASLAIRGVSRVLLRTPARTMYTRAHQVVPAHLVRMVEIRAGAHQHVRSFVLSSARFMQAQVDPEENTEAETSSENNQLNKSEEQQMLDKKLYKMDLDLRKFNRVSPSELDEVIYIMGRCNSFTSTQALLLLRLCGSACTDDSKQIRQKRMEKLLPELKSRTMLDVSHYNAILKMNIDNDVKVDISKFLTEMDTSGVIPNRVTYNYLIGLYCMEGNITGATTVLEQMKDEGMTINESVFHSLLYGHVYNKDKDSTKETLHIMESSGLLPGAETYTMMLLAAAKAKDGDRVEELLQETVQQDIKLDAGDHFKLMIALCENGMGSEAENMVDKVPKRAGYFQEMRSCIPQLVYAGHPELAIYILEDFTGITNNTKNVTNLEERKRSQAVFLSRVIAKSDTAPDRAADIVLKMFGEGQTQQLVAYIQECIEQKKDTNIQVLQDKMKETTENTNKIYSDDPTAFLLRQARNSIPDFDHATKTLRSFRLYVDFQRLAWGLIRQEYDPDKVQPAGVVSQLSNQQNQVPYHIILYQMYNFLLHERSERATRDLNGCLLFGPRIRDRDVGEFRRRLLENALEFDSTELLINILFRARNFQPANDDQINKNLYRHVLGDMNRLEGGLKLLNTVLLEINKYKLGVPRSVADNLRSQINDAEIQELLDVAVTDYETPDIWTEDTIVAFLNKRKDLHSEALRKSGYTTSRQQNNYNNYKGYFEIPDDLNTQYKIKNVLSNRGETNIRLGVNMIRSLAESDKPVEAVEELAEIRKKIDFTLYSIDTDVVIRSFVRNDKPQEALNFLFKDVEEFFLSTYIHICEGFAQQGDHAKVMELLNNIPDLAKEKKILNNQTRNNIGILKRYESMGDVENLTNAFEAIQEINPSGDMRQLLGPLVNVHLHQDNIPGALEAFETLSRKYKTLPASYDLMTRLVCEEKVEDLQKVIDMSISMRGEEMVLYQLTQVFLEYDRRSQAKKMLETPGLMYNQREMDRIIKFFVDKRKWDSLEDLVIMSKNLFGCDRDHLFYAWVKAVRKNPNKIEEIWIQIQDEGHAPSVNLKSEIAKALKSANRTIPFSTDDLDMEDKPNTPTPKAASTAAPKAASTAAPKAARKAAVKKDKPKQNDSLTDSELQNLVDSLKNETSEQKLVDGLHTLIRNEKLAEAAQIMHQSQMLKRSPVEKLVGVYGRRQQYQELDSFVAGFSEETRNTFRFDNMTKIYNTERLVDLVKATDVDDNTIVRKLNFKEVEKLFEKKPDVKSELEALSNGGHLPATLVLARVAIHNQDTEALARCWNWDTSEDKKDIKHMARNIRAINDLNHLRWLTENFNDDHEVVRKSTNALISSNKSPEQTIEIIDYSMQHGLTLDNVNTKSLKGLLGLDQFGHKDEIQRILKEREGQKSTNDSTAETS